MHTYVCCCHDVFGCVPDAVTCMAWIHTTPHETRSQMHLRNLEIIIVPCCTKFTLVSPRALTMVLLWVPEEIRVHEEHTGAMTCSAPGTEQSAAFSAHLRLTCVGPMCLQECMNACVSNDPGTWIHCACSYPWIRSRSNHDHKQTLPFRPPGMLL